MTTQVNYYIATRGSEAGITRARKVRDALAAHGWKWTMDWTIVMEANFAAGKRDTDLTFEEKQAFAIADRDAVQQADIVFYLEDPEKSEGGAGKFCYADAADTLLVAVCPGIPRCLFVTLADEIFTSDEAAIEWALAQPWEAG